MANTVLKNHRLPAGTTCYAYAQAFAERQAVAGQAPVGLTQVDSATVASDGTLTLTSLTAGVPYRVYGLVGSEHRWVATTGS